MKKKSKNRYAFIMAAVFAVVIAMSAVFAVTPKVGAAQMEEELLVSDLIMEPEIMTISLDEDTDSADTDNEYVEAAEEEIEQEDAESADLENESEEKTEKLSFTERIAAKFATSLGKYVPAQVVVVIVSMLPILELRAGLFVAKFLDLPLIQAIPLCVIGNIIPIPLILLFIKKIFKWLGKTKLFHKLIEKLEARAMKKSSALANGEFVGLLLFVGIPIPGTGAWMGSLIAALLEIDIKKAIAAELCGIVIATIIVSILSYGLLGIFI